MSVLDVLLDSWDRNNTILVNLLCALPRVPCRPACIGQMLSDSATAVREAVSGRLAAGKPMDQH